MLSITKNIEDNKAVFMLEGRLDTNTSIELEDSIKESVEGLNELTLDIENLEYISSAGLRVLLSAQKIMNEKGSMTVKGASEIIMEIFEVTGFVDLLNIEQ